MQYVNSPITTSAETGTRQRALGVDDDEYNPRRDLRLIALTVLVFGTLTVGILGFGATPVLEDDDDDGTVFPFQDLRDDGPEDIHLVIDANRTSITPGEAVQFTVAYENGTAADDAILATDGEEYTLDGDGQATVVFDHGGEFTVTADRDGTERTRYVADATIISVDRFEVELSLDADRAEVVAGDDITFSLQRADTSEAVAGSVTVAGETHETDSVGTVTVPFESAGTFEATATKSDTPTETFLEETTTVSVDRRTISLSVRQDPTAPTVGEEVLVEISRDDTGELIDGTVAVNGEQRVAPNGTLTLAAERATTVELSISAPETDSERFTEEARTIRFERQTAQLSLDANSTTVERGEPVEFTAVRTDTNEPVPGTLTAGDRSYWLDWQGSATVSFEDAGTVPVAAKRANTTTHTFPSDEVDITVLDTQYRIDEISAPETVDSGGDATVEAVIHNAGADAGTATVEYTFDENEHATRTVELGAGERETVTFEIPTEVDPGEYDHAVTTRDDHVSTSVTIEDVES